MYELAVHQFAIDESTVWKISTRETTVHEAAVYKIATGKQTPVPVNFLERTCVKIRAH
jgi:hypothetical protein